MHCKIVTFNLLAQKLINKDYFPQSVMPDSALYYTFPYRSNRVKSLLDNWTFENYIICLQEIDDSWHLFLNNYFNNTRYSFHFSKINTSELRVCTAYPNDIYSLININYFSAYETFSNHIFPKEFDNQSPYYKDITDSIKAKQTLLTILLISKSNNKQHHLMIANYHMPCKFSRPFYMATQLRIIQSHLYQLQKSWFSLYFLPISSLFCGDMNIIPSSPLYPLFFSKKSPPMFKELFSFLQLFNIISKKFAVFHSAYYRLHSREPSTTNVSFANKFCDCIDYIFVDNTIHVSSCLITFLQPDLCQNPNTFFPNSICPSDHLPLSTSIIV
jgi:mRNA deadenylase 3'-5' endonuclease subunit Ccr4